MEDRNGHSPSPATGMPTEQLHTVTPPTAEEIQEWLAVQIAAQTGADPEAMDLRAPFRSYGLTSLQATSITSLGKQTFGIPLSPLVLWNFPNIEALSQHLAEELAAGEVEMLEI